jgi:hypothetical protein
VDYRPIFKAIDRTPFESFTIELESGRLVKVTHPEQVIFIPNRMKIWMVTVVDEENDTLVSFDASVVTAVEEVRNGGKARSGRKRS